MTTSEKKNQKASNGKKAGDVLGTWVLKHILGQGGNGDVWEVTNPSGEPHALKILHKTKSEAVARFKTEISVLSRIGHIDGIVPLIESDLNGLPPDNSPWYVMPLAEPFEKYRKRTGLLTLLKDFVSLAETLTRLHAQGYSHRDIKPANILYFNGRLCFSDFGLVKYPGKPDLTPDKRDVGAKFTMAPEMRRHAAQSDGAPADVYSFAKSLWIAITNNELGFDGQYIPNGALCIKPHIEKLYATPIEQLLSECTNTDPLQRPKMSDVRDRLTEWIEISEDFQARNELEWIEVGSKLFPFGIPSRALWIDIDEICSVLNVATGAAGLNHMFYPDGGGMTIIGACRANESGLIELKRHAKSVDVLKPKKLTFESFGKDFEWCYFRLEAAPIEPTGIKNSLRSEGICEELVELTANEYVEPSCWDYDEFNGKPLPETARRVQRYLKGSFVIFSTTSMYNQVPDTYDARHDAMSEDQFREYIQRSANQLRALLSQR